MGGRLFFSDPEVKAYSYLSHRIVSKNRFDEILTNAKSTKWPNSPSNNGNISWSTWEKDISIILEGE